MCWSDCNEERSAGANDEYEKNYFGAGGGAVGRTFSRLFDVVAHVLENAAVRNVLLFRTHIAFERIRRRGTERIHPLIGIRRPFEWIRAFERFSALEREAVIPLAMARVRRLLTLRVIVHR